MRNLASYIKKDLIKKMVFISAPRQCGKTTLAMEILNGYSSGQYKNISPHLSYFAEKLKVPRAIQITAQPDLTFVRGHLKVTNVFEEFRDLKRYF